MISLSDRIAGAPISWGVDGSPGWGYLLASDRVLGEMASIGLSATELGPDGFLGKSPVEARRTAASAGLSVVGGFVPLLLHRSFRGGEQSAYADRAIKTLAACGAEVLVLARASRLDRGADRPDNHPAHRLLQRSAGDGHQIAVLHHHPGVVVHLPGLGGGHPATDDQPDPVGWI